MKRPSPAILGSIALHAGVVAVTLVSWPRTEPEIKPTISSVPVSIVSSLEVAAAPADNPSDEVVEDDAVSAPEAPPEPTPAPPEPTPPPPPPTPTPTTRPVTSAPAPRPTPTPAPAPKKATPTPPRPAPTPPRATPTPPRATPPRTTPAPTRPAPKSDAPPLDLDALAGPSRPATNRGTRPATGQQGAGRAPQATGAQITAIFNQVSPDWPPLVCESAGAEALRVRVSVSLSADGRVTKGPTLVSPGADVIYRTAADRVLSGIRAVGRFDVPDGFAGGDFLPTYTTRQACADR